MAGRNEVGISLTAKDLASREINRVGGAIRDVGGAAEETTTKTGRLGRIASGVFQGVFLGAGMYAFGAIRNGFSFVKDSTIGFNNQLQNSAIGFTTMLGSGQKAQAFLDSLKDFAAKTPFQFSDLVTASQRMLAMGFAAKDVIPDLTAVGDAAAALGASPETIDRVTLALGQMHAKGKVSAEEMLQLTEAGIPAWDLLSKATGKSTQELMKLSEKGLLPADAAIKGITAGMEQRFGGMMDKTSHTFSGAMSTIHDVTQNVMATAFRPLFDLVSSAADQLAQFLSSGGAEEWGNRIASAVQTVIGWAKTVIGVFAQVAHILAPVAQAFGYIFAVIASGEDVASGLHETIGNLGEKLSDLGARISAFVGSINFDAILDRMAAFRQRILDLIGGIIAGIAKALPDAIRNLSAQLPGILNTVLPLIIRWVSTAANQFMAFISEGVDNLSKNFPAILDALRGLFQTIFDWIINDGVPMAAAALADFGAHFLDWVFDVGPKLLDMLNALIGAVIQFVIDNGPTLVAKLVEWGIAFVGWIATVAIPKLIENLPFILAALMTFLGGAGVKLVGKLGEVGSLMVATLITWLKRMPGETAAWLAKVIERVAVWVGVMLIRAHDAAVGFVSRVVEFIKELPFKVAGLLLEVIGKVVQWSAQLLSKGGEAAGNFIQTILGIVGGLPAKIAGFLGSIITMIAGWGGGILRGAVQAAGNFVRGFIDALGSLPGKIADAIGNAFRSIHIDIGPFHISANGVSIDLPHIDLPHFATGAWKLPADMMAVVHKGEMIIPSDIAARLRGEQGAPAPGEAVSSMATAAGSAPTAIVQISNYYGPGSVRSDDDIRRISEEQAENVRLMGFTPVLRTAGSLG